VTVCASDSRALGPPRGWWRGDGLKNLVRIGGGGGVTSRFTLGGTARRLLPTLEAQH
jgi:hypothetical protein